MYLVSCLHPAQHLRTQLEAVLPVCVPEFASDNCHKGFLSQQTTVHMILKGQPATVYTRL